MSYTERFTEVHYPLASENADSQAAGNHDSAYVSLRDYHRAILLLNVGEMQAGATLDASIRQAQDSSGTGVKAITGKSITQLTQAGGDGDQLLAIELRTEELDIANGFEHISFRVTVASANVEYAAWLFGIVPRFSPTPTTNWEEIVD